MPFPAKVYKVMIASPSDVVNERSLIHSVVHEWNAVHGSARGAILMPVGWETHVAPEAGARPQAIINDRILKDSDLLVGVFWTRLGTPTGEHASGTVEEVEEHLAANRPVMLYFSDAPVRLDSVDSAQYQALTEFKESYQSRALYGTFDSPSSFREKFARDLAITMIRLHEGGSSAAVESRAPERARLEPFVQRVPRVASMSEAAQDLLIRASRAHDGTVLRVPVLNGPMFQVGGELLNSENSAREIAKWESALSELTQLGFMRETGSRGEVFLVTARGYEEADRLIAARDA